MGDAAAVAAGLTAELHLKMSKKIAQLTKVIFHLNTRNEDFQLELARSRAAHGDETQRLAVDAAAKLRTLQDESGRVAAAEKARRSELELALQSAERQGETDKRKAEALLARLSESEDAFKATVRGLEARIASAEEAFKRRLRELQSSSEQGEQQKTRDAKKHAAEMESVREQWSAQTEALKQQHATDSRRIAQEGEAMMERLTSGHRVELERLEQQRKADEHQRQQLQQRLEAHEQRLKQQEQQLTSQLSSLEASRTSALQAERETHATTTRELLGKMESLLAESEALRAAETALRRDKQALMGDKVELEQEKRALEQALASAQDLAQSVRRDADADGDKLRELLALSTDKIEQLACELAELKTELQSREREVDEVTKQLGLARSEAERRAANDSEVEAKLQHQLKDREREAAAAKVELLRANQQAASAEAELEKRIRDAEEAAASAARQAKRQIDDQAMQISDLTANLASTKQRAGESEDRLAKALEEHSREQQRLESDRKEKAQQVASMEEQLRQLELKTREAVESASASASAMLSAQLSALKTQHEAEMQGKQRELSDRQRESELKHAQHLAAELERVKRETKADAEKQLAALKQQLTATIEATKQAQEKAAQQLRREHDEAVRKLHSALASQREAGNKQIVEREALAQRQKQQEVLELAQQHDESLKRLEQQWREQLMRQLAEQRGDCESQLEQMREEASRSKADVAIQQREAGEALSMLRERTGLAFEELRSAVDAFARRAEAERSYLNDQATRERSEAKKRHDEALQALEARLRTESQRLLDRLRDEATRERVDLTNKHATDLDILRNVHDSRLRELRTTLESDKNTALLSARAEFAKQKTELGAEKDCERRNAVQKLQAEHMQELEEMTKRLFDATATLARVSTDLALAQREIERLHGVLDAKAQEMSERVAALEAAAREEVEKLKRAAKRDMDKLLEENLAETKQLSDEFEETRRLMTNKCNELVSAVRAWEDKYARRESREEDVARIAELARAVAERDALVKRTLDEMAYFKREMLNREETYNKTFARTPNVGVLQVLKPHVQLQAQLQASGLHNNSVNNSVGYAPVATAPHSKRKAKPARTAGTGVGLEPELQRRHSVGVSASVAATSTGPSSSRGLPPLGSNQTAV